jgi:DNA-directed RNA polymerase subunit M/transcription elongation factor TFIIS
MERIGFCDDKSEFSANWLIEMMRSAVGSEPVLLARHNGRNAAGRLLNVKIELPNHSIPGEVMAKIAKTADRKKVMDTTKSTDCPKCGKPTRIVKRVKDRERGIPGGIFISCSGCEFYEKL